MHKALFIGRLCACFLCTVMHNSHYSRYTQKHIHTPGKRRYRGTVKKIYATMQQISYLHGLSKSILCTTTQAAINQDSKLCMVGKMIPCAEGQDKAYCCWHDICSHPTITPCCYFVSCFLISLGLLIWFICPHKLLSYANAISLLFIPSSSLMKTANKHRPYTDLYINSGNLPTIQCVHIYQQCFSTVHQPLFGPSKSKS